jgi:nucleoid-associated protein YgaU
MSEALSHDVIQFDDAPRPGVAPEDSTAEIGRVLEQAGIDAPCALYNEALEFSRDGKLGPAQSRLQMLLCLDPDDADASLLLAKVHAAQGKMLDALARLDAAVEAGAVPPAGFRDYLEAALRAERLRDEENRARIAVREQSEVKALRAEARQLRSDNVRLETEVDTSVGRERLWKWATIGASAFGSAVILVMAAMIPGQPAAERLAEQPPSFAAVEAPAPIEMPPAAEVPVLAAPEPTLEEAAAVLASTEVEGPRMHEVSGGDTLYKLARRYYDDPTQWERIRDANAALLAGSIDLKLGTRLVIP